MTLARLRVRRQEILRIASKHGARNVRVFGSVARGDADCRSDVDLLVDIEADVKGLAYFGLVEELRRALSTSLGQPVDIVDFAALNRLREPVLRDAVDL
ncbi:MAG: nucleotidyltransferase family protein [Chloroflexota bacterium]